MKLFSAKSATTELHELENNVLFIGDTFNSEVLSNVTAYSQPKYIVNDHWSSIEIADQRIYSAPLWLANQVELLKPDDLPQISDQYTFNFMINKKQINRYLCIKLVEMFKLADYNYTWSGIGRNFDLNEIIIEINKLGVDSPFNEFQRSFLLEPIKLSELFIKNTDTVSNNDVNIPYLGNAWTWTNIFKNFFSSSAIALITESVRDEIGAVFTEKTAYATLGLNFPIWVGGYNQAAEWIKMGFDIFDDVVDHSYQNKSTLIERCYYAVFDNLELLENKELAHALRKKNIDRLMSNRSLLLDYQVVKSCQDNIKRWPSDLQNIMPEIYNYYPKIKHLF